MAEDENTDGEHVIYMKELNARALLRDSLACPAALG